MEPYFSCRAAQGVTEVLYTESYSLHFACFGIEWENETPDNNIILWDTVRINIGGHYDIATGTYTAPVNGLYQFQVQVGKYIY